MSNYANPGGLIVLGALLPILGLITTVLRFYSRGRLQNSKLLIDDWLLIPAEFLLICMGVALIIGVAGHGEGYRLPAEANGVSTDGNTGGVDVEILTDKVEFVIFAISQLQIGCAKLSILFFYRRIFCTSTTDVLNLATLSMIIITAMWTIAFFFANLFECGTHFSLNWEATPTQTLALCIQETKMTEGNIFSDFILDVIILVMPLSTIWKLHLPLRRRLAVIVILIIGALTVIASLIKVVIIIGLVYTLNNNLLASDPDIIVSIIMFWTMLESGLATIVISLPTLRALMDKSPELLRSLRSMISFHSLTSNALRSKTNIRSSDDRYDLSQADTRKISALEDGTNMETYAMKDVPAHSASKSGITTSSHITQESRDL